MNLIWFLFIYVLRDGILFTEQLIFEKKLNLRTAVIVGNSNAVVTVSTLH